MISVNSLELISLEFFTGNPQSVRGLGNILLDKEELDMLEYYSQVAETEDIVNETSMKVFSMSYLDDSGDDLTLYYDVNSFLLGAVKSVSVNDGKLEVNRYESSDLEVVTLRQLKHVLSNKVKDITYENNVLQVVSFERSDLFGLQTKAAIVELLANAVSDVRIVNNKLVIERWSAADVENGITELEFEPHISVSATNPYLVSGETTDLVVRLVTEFGSPVSGKTVTLTDGTSVYSGLTNLNGIFTLSNVNVSQDTTFTATYSNVSDSVTVEYCTFADYCTRTNNKSSGYYQTRGTYSLDDEGLTITAGSDEFNFREYNGEITIPYKIRFELLNTTDNSTRVYFYNGNYSQVKASGSIYKVNNQPTMIEFTVTSSGITRKIGDTSTELTIIGTIGSTVSFRFGNTNANSSIKYRNFRIKPVSQ